MLNCLYERKRICSLDLKNQYNNYITDLKIEWKIASQDSKLYCEECGTLVVLKAGEHKEPHFAHKGGYNRDCYYEQAPRESEEHLRGKRILYHYLSTLYPNEQIHINYRHPNKRRSDIYIESTSGNKLVIEYQRTDLKVSQWQERHDAYKAMGIRDFWILSYQEFLKEKNKRGEKEGVKKLNFFNELLLYRSIDNTVKFLDTTSNTLILIKKMQFMDNDTGQLKYFKLFHKKYNLDSITISLDGKINSNFEELYNAEYEKFIFKCNKKEKELEEMRKQKEEIEKIRESYEKNVINKPIKKSERAIHASEKMGTCKHCGKYTSEWGYFDGRDNTCLCYDCIYKKDDNISI